jgi:hypothetical protein
MPKGPDLSVKATFATIYKGTCFGWGLDLGGFTVFIVDQRFVLNWEGHSG